LSGSVKGRNIYKNMRFCDLGDLDVASGSFEVTSCRLKGAVEEIRQESSAFPVFIGGEHSISLPLVEALKPKSVIVFDAHADLFTEYNEVRFSHATWAYHASRIVKIYMIGNTVMHDEESLSPNVVMIDNPKSFDFSSVEQPCHLSIDIDVLDPSLVKTGIPEGIMDKKTFFSLVDKVRCASMDVVEICDSSLPSSTAFIAAEAIKIVLANNVKVK